MPRRVQTPPALDHIDIVIADWAEQRPDLDVAPIAVIARVGRLAGHLGVAVDATLGEFGLNRGSFEVLATLRRAGAPYRRPLHALVAAQAVTPGSMSVRIDRLESLGLVRREADPDDGRGVLVALTLTGLATFDAAAPAHLANEARLLAPLAPTERAALADLLRRSLLLFETPDGRPHRAVAS